MPEIFVISGGTGSRNFSKQYLRSLHHEVNFSTVGDSSVIAPNMNFILEDYKRVAYPHDDPLVISVDVTNHCVHQVLVGGGSSANILFRGAFDAMKLDPKYLIPVHFLVIGFNGSSAIPDERITLPVTFRKGRAVKK